MVDFGEWTLAEISNPWDSTSTLGRFALVKRDGEKPSLPDDVSIIEVPVKRCAIFSSVHGGILEQLGTDSIICAVADAGYFNSARIRNRIASGAIVDLGPVTSPAIEKIIAAHPDVILTSPMQNDDHGGIGRSGIDILEMADYLETTPLGRAEWVKLLGVLTGCREAANAHFNGVKQRYLKLKELASNAPEKPKTITENIYQGVWYMPGGNSYKANMLIDAGTIYPWSDDRSTGSLSLSLPQVLEKAHDAEVWIMTTYGYDLSHEKMLVDEPRVANIKAFEKGLWSVDTQKSPLFDEFPFNPDRLLADYIYIVHPSLRDSIGQTRYFRHVVQ